MTLIVEIQKNTYIDSVSLMALSTKANQLPGVDQVIIAMGTEMNKEVMTNVGLFNEEVAAAEASDLIIVLKIEADATGSEVLAAVKQSMLERGSQAKSKEVEVKTIADGVTALPDANLALISLNGQYAAREAFRALDQDLHVMMFSDNVSVEDEVKLKELALKKDLLMMGPDCGTAIINNVGLGFANKVRKGNIGIVGASGTGSQEVSVRINEFGGGISQMIGTGGRDLSEAVGGKMMLAGLEALAADKSTEVIVLISKPPAASVAEKIIAQAKQSGKPVVIWFVGSEERESIENVHFERRSKDAALLALKLAGIDLSKQDLHPLNLPLIAEVQAKLAPEQRYIRGLFTGGTLCDEALFIANEKFADVYSNVGNEATLKLENNHVSKGHTFIDFGDDQFTQGRPHPMIDGSIRKERFKKEAADPSVGVILLDFVLGYGASEDPVGDILPEIIAAKEAAKEAGRHLEVIGYVLGTDSDRQVLTAQIEKLVNAGATYASSNQNASLLAREFVVKGAN